MPPGVVRMPRTAISSGARIGGSAAFCAATMVVFAIAFSILMSGSASIAGLSP